MRPRATDRPARPTGRPQKPPSSSTASTARETQRATTRRWFIPLSGIESLRNECAILGEHEEPWVDPLHVGRRGEHCDCGLAWRRELQATFARAKPRQVEEATAVGEKPGPLGTILVGLQLHRHLRHSPFGRHTEDSGTAL